MGSHGITWGETYQNVLEGYFKHEFGHSPKVIRFHHHDAHAASAYYASGFDEAMVLSIDNSGDGVSTELAVGKGSEMKVVEQIERPNSLGIYYSLLTQFCGFIRDSDEYKLMGLSSYGNRDAYDFSWLLKVENGHYHFNTDYIKQVKPGESQPSRQQAMYGEKLIEKLGKHRRSGEPVTDFYKNVAASAQQQLESAIVALVTRFHEETGLRKICLAGGVALNCVANQKIMNLDFIDEIYVQPASSDAGISLGAAYLAAAEMGDTPQKMEHAFLGPPYSNNEIKKVLDLLQLDYKRCDSPALVAAEMVAQNKVVGWFQGNMEFGPRALGTRSILANPAQKEMQDIVNHKIKFRESFRPFCPSVLENESKAFFVGKQDSSPYMTITYDANERSVKEIPAVVHVDQTARIQTVNRETSPLYHEYLTELKKLTGIGVSLNTSFNRNNEPIVCSPVDAVSAFYGCGMDGLIIGDFVLKK